MPKGFAEKITAELGQDIAKRLLEALSLAPSVGLRLNKRKAIPTDAPDGELRPKAPLYPGMSRVGWCDSGYYLEERPKFTLNPLLHAGAFYVQDPSSMVYERIVGNLVGSQPVLAADLCAAPGGKTTAIINALPEGSALLANEFIATRAAILKENLTKWGYPGVVATNTDTSRLSAMGEMFGIVAVDAPCSGEGMMRKEEAARSQWSEGLIKQCASLQREIVRNAAEMVAPGGYLIYSTCTFNTDEDEDNAAWIAEELGLLPVDTGMAGSDGIMPEAKGKVPCLRFMPGFTRGEGLFVAVFRKPEAASGSAHFKMPKKTKGNKKDKMEKGILERAKSWIEIDVEVRPHEDRLLALTETTARLLDAIPKGVRIVSAGVEIGDIKGKDLVPAHALAMSTAFSRVFPEVELPESEALRYLSREAITLPADTALGYVTLTFRGMPLGFAKNIGNRCNSLYPNEWRVRGGRVES